LETFRHSGLDIPGFIPGSEVWLWFEFQILSDQRPDYEMKRGFNAVQGSRNQKTLTFFVSWVPAQPYLLPNILHRIGGSNRRPVVEEILDLHLRRVCG
jgi:hypothetical protein